jgi:hypothetical protein
MQAIKAQQISPSPVCPHSSTETHALRYSEVLRRGGLRVFLQLLRENLVQRLRIWRGAFRSCRGHIRTQSATGQVGVHLGPHGHLGAINARTLVRTLLWVIKIPYITNINDLGISSTGDVSLRFLP